jgi:hypothetical protein
MKGKEKNKRKTVKRTARQQTQCRNILWNEKTATEVEEKQFEIFCSHSLTTWLKVFDVKSGPTKIGLIFVDLPVTMYVTSVFALCTSVLHLND